MNEQPKWQRARIINSPDQPELLGAELWVKAEQPRSYKALDIQTDEPVPRIPEFYTFLIHKGLPCSVAASDTELLARDENDFAESVELIPWETFLEQCRATPAKEPTR